MVLELLLDVLEMLLEVLDLALVRDPVFLLVFSGIIGFPGGRPERRTPGRRTDTPRT